MGSLAPKKLLTGFRDVEKEWRHILKRNQFLEVCFWSKNFIYIIKNLKIHQTKIFIILPMTHNHFNTTICFYIWISSLLSYYTCIRVYMCIVSKKDEILMNMLIFKGKFLQWHLNSQVVDCWWLLPIGWHLKVYELMWLNILFLLPVFFLAPLSHDTRSLAENNCAFRT